MILGRKSEKRRKVSSKNPNIRAPDSKPSNIRSMFAAAAVKPKKQTEVKTTFDLILISNFFAFLRYENPGSSSECIVL